MKTPVTNSQFTSLEAFPLLAVTFNVNAKIESAANIKDKLIFTEFDEFLQAQGFTPKIVVIGLQEMIALNTSNVLRDDSGINNILGLGGNTSGTIHPTATRTSPASSTLKTPAHKSLVINTTKLGDENGAIPIALPSPKSSSNPKTVMNRWQTTFLAALHEKVDSSFTLLSSSCMVGLALFVYVTAEVASHTYNLQAQCLPRGVGGVLGNKGALYVRMQLYDTSICFINSHLAAHRNGVRKRNSDYHAIYNAKIFTDPLQTIHDVLSAQTGMKQDKTIKKLREKQDILKQKLAKMMSIPDETMEEVIAGCSSSSKVTLKLTRNALSNTALSLLGTTSHFSTAPSMNPSENNNSVAASGASGGNFPTNLSEKEVNNANKDDISSANKMFAAKDHDIILWLGDLNYRIEDSLTTSTVFKHIYSDDIITLSAYDQLSQEREKNVVFQEFSEGLLTFPPTYQYIPGQDIYDERKDKKRRCPAWCDRILWRVRNAVVTDETFCVSSAVDLQNPDNGLPFNEEIENSSCSRSVASSVGSSDDEIEELSAKIKRRSFNKKFESNTPKESTPMSSSSNQGNKGENKMFTFPSDRSMRSMEENDMDDTASEASDVSEVGELSEWVNGEKVESSEVVHAIAKSLLTRASVRLSASRESLISQFKRQPAFNIVVKGADSDRDRLSGSFSNNAAGIATMDSASDVHNSVSSFSSRMSRPSPRNAAVNLPPSLLPPSEGSLQEIPLLSPALSSPKGNGFKSFFPATSSSSAGNTAEIVETMELIQYSRCDNTISDHKPVRALLNMKVKR